MKPTYHFIVFSSKESRNDVVHVSRKSWGSKFSILFQRENFCCPVSRSSDDVLRICRPLNTHNLVRMTNICFEELKWRKFLFEWGSFPNLSFFEKSDNKISKERKKEEIVKKNWATMMKNAVLSIGTETNAVDAFFEVVLPENNTTTEIN